jgi:hypothetical protein
MTQVVFNYTNWVTRYPEFAAVVDSTKAADLFTQAGLYLSNADGSPVQDIPTRTLLLYMVVAHLAQLNFGSALVANNPIVGRMDSAQEGTVNLTTKYPDQAGLAAWYSQTKYGAEFWAATARYRVAVYRPGPRRRMWPC